MAGGRKRQSQKGGEHVGVGTNAAGRTESPEDGREGKRLELELRLNRKKEARAAGLDGGCSLPSREAYRHLRWESQRCCAENPLGWVLSRRQQSRGLACCLHRPRSRPRVVQRSLGRDGRCGENVVREDPSSQTVRSTGGVRAGAVRTG